MHPLIRITYDYVIRIINYAASHVRPHFILKYFKNITAPKRSHKTLALAKKENIIDIQCFSFTVWFRSLQNYLRWIQLLDRFRRS